MHKHHGTLRLLIILVSLVLVGAAVYLVLIYGFGLTTNGNTTATSTAVVFPISEQGGTSSTTSATSSPIITTPPTGAIGTTSYTGGMTVITNADNNTTIELSKNERFVIQLGGGLKWSLSFDPSTGISRVPNSTTADGIQGVYEADAVGTTTLHATGAPICAAHEACPMLLAVMTATFVVH